MGDNTEHARLGCSNPRWEPCPGSVREEAAYPNISTAAAMDGTGSHLLLEMCMKSGVPAKQYSGHTIGLGHHDSPQKMGWYVDEDRIKRVQLQLDYIEERVSGLKNNPEYRPDTKIVVLSETRSNPGQFHNRDDWWGTCDIFIYTIDPVSNELLYAEVCDYKDGHRWVSEVDNSQLLDYLSGKVYELESSGVKVNYTTPMNVSICQPKTKVPRRTAPTTWLTLIAHTKRRVAAAARTDDPNAPLSAGKHCTFCRHDSNCEAKKQTNIQKGNIMDNNIIQKVETSLQTMPAEELVLILNAKEALLDAIAKAEGEAMKRLEAGEPVPGYFIGDGPASAKWNVDEDTLLKKFAGMKVPKDERVTTKVLSPAQARKLTCLSDKQKVNLESLITTMAGKPTLKKGESKKPDAKEMFAGAVEQEEPAKLSDKSSFDFM